MMGEREREEGKKEERKKGKRRNLIVFLDLVFIEVRYIFDIFNNMR